MGRLSDEDSADTNVTVSTTSAPTSRSAPTSSGNIGNVNDDHVAQLVEPMSLRSNINEKFFVHFQNFHNEHDEMAIGSLLMIPCCHSDVVRDAFGWMRMTHNARFLST